MLKKYGTVSKPLPNGLEVRLHMAGRMQGIFLMTVSTRSRSFYIVEEKKMKLCGTQEIREKELYIGGIGVGALARTFGTPLYIMDEEAIRMEMRRFQAAFTHETLETEVLYASKAFLTRAMVRLLKEEGLSMDVVSGGELYTALLEDFPREKIYFHGNNKSMEELSYALEEGVGTLVVDHEEELQRLCGLLKGTSRKQRVLLRVNPGIEAHTHEYISTTKNDSKFGLSIYDEETLVLLQRMSQEPNIDFQGIHCHIGSQIFEEDSFQKAASTMVDFMRKALDQGVSMKVLNLGGGFGVHYVEGDAPLSYEAFFPRLLAAIWAKAQEVGLGKLRVLIEPGRSLVATAGITLYEVGSTKKTYGGRQYVFVDGSMADHLRTALYDADYEAVLANRMGEAKVEAYRVTGKACESGDILVKNAWLPKPKPGDLLAVLSTGAYHYSMAMNYNRFRKPPVVFVKDGEAKLVVKRETYADLTRNDL